PIVAFAAIWPLASPRPSGVGRRTASLDNMPNATGALLAPVDAGHTSGHSSAPPRDGARVRGPQLRWSALVALGVLLAQLAATVRSPAGAESLSSLRARREAARSRHAQLASQIDVMRASDAQLMSAVQSLTKEVDVQAASVDAARLALDRKSTRLNSSHLVISYAVFCLKKKNNLLFAT